VSLRVAATACTGPIDPAYRIRLAAPGQALAYLDVDVDLLPLFTESEARRFRGGGLASKAATLVPARRRMRQVLGDLGPDAGVVVVHRQVDLTPSLALEKLATGGRRLIYDVDDAVWITGRQTGGHPLSFVKGSARKVRWLAQRADHLTVGNQILAEYMQRYNANVTIVPSLVDLALYPIREHRQDEVLTLGWVGSSTTAPYLQTLTPALEQLAARSARPVRLLVVGGRAPRPAGVEVREESWSLDAERRAFETMDIGLMPLDDTPWSRGKCAYKALQYMACGIPAVVDDVGISADTVRGAGCIATGKAQWLESLEALAVDASLRAQLGRVGHERIESRFSLDRWLPTIAGILREGS
jgi:glycosyltransferase involved in cell wall biosynthesis